MSGPALAVTCAGCWQNKLMRVIYHAARTLSSRVPCPAIVSVVSHLSCHSGLSERRDEERREEKERERQDVEELSGERD